NGLLLSTPDPGRSSCFDTAATGTPPSSTDDGSAHADAPRTPPRTPHTDATPARRQRSCHAIASSFPYGSETPSPVHPATHSTSQRDSTRGEGSPGGCPLMSWCPGRCAVRL